MSETKWLRCCCWPRMGWRFFSVLLSLLLLCVCILSPTNLLTMVMSSDGGAVASLTSQSTGKSIKWLYHTTMVCTCIGCPNSVHVFFSCMQRFRFCFYFCLSWNIRKDIATLNALKPLKMSRWALILHDNIAYSFWNCFWYERTQAGAMCVHAKVEYKCIVCVWLMTWWFFSILWCQCI